MLRGRRAALSAALLPSPPVLRDLHIRNLAVVEEATLEIGRGFNVLTGETGAGKSIVVDSLSLLAGVRASTDLIRTGAESLIVTGVFEPGEGEWRDRLREAGIEIDDDEVELVVRREVSRAGRNRVFVQDRPVTLRLLVDLAPELLRIHGQREELGLVAPELQRAWLDRCGGEAGEELLAEVGDRYAAWSAIAERMERRTGDERLRRERIDLLRFQVREIDEVAMEEGEEEELRRERAVLRHLEAIRDGLGRSCARLFDDDGAALDSISRSAQDLEEVARWEDAAREWAAELDEMAIRLSELERSLRSRLDDLDEDPGRLDAIETRLATLERLLRKYGGTSTSTLEHRREAAAELEELEVDAQGLEALEAQARAAVAGYRESAERLTASRREWASGLAERVRAQLGDLGLGSSRFEVALERRSRSDSPLLIDGRATDLGPTGIDQVTFLFSPNPGEDLLPLASAASGGELSRLYLAVQLAAGDSGAEATLVFDEVDAGISGAQAALLGRKLRTLGEGGQVLAVTHLPQVASQGEGHFRVEKTTDGASTRTRVTRLSEEERVEEVARMLAGRKVTEKALSNARELLASVDG